MVKLGAIAIGLLTFATEVCAQKTVKVMPFGASIVSVSSLLEFNPPTIPILGTDSYLSVAGAQSCKLSSGMAVSPISTLSAQRPVAALAPTSTRTTKVTQDLSPSITQRTET